MALFARHLARAAVLTAFVAKVASAEPSDADRKAAQVSFQEGQRAFKAGDFKRAAEAFEEAYRRAPHHAPLWNAGRAWHQAGDLVRAANTYSKYLREAPPEAPDRSKALVALKELQAKLGRLDVHASNVQSVTIDGEGLEGDSLYVAPGAHVVEGRTPAKEVVRQSPQVTAGEVVSVALVPPPPEPRAAAPPAASKPAAPSEPPRRERSGLSPAFVVVGGVLTLVAGGVTLWSTLDVSAQKRDYLNGPRTQAAYDAGKAAETRTNVLLGVTGGLAVLTAVTALFLVDWKPRDHVAVGSDRIVVFGAF